MLVMGSEGWKQPANAGSCQGVGVRFLFVYDQDSVSKLVGERQVAFLACCS